MDRPLLTLIALLLNAALAGPRQWYAALGLTKYGRIPASTLRDIERRLNREHRSAEDRFLRGIIVVAITIVGSIVGGLILGWVFQYNLRFVELVIVAACLPVRPTWDCVSRIYKCLRGGDPDGARKALEHTAWRHHVLLDEYGVGRAGIEMLAVHFSEKILAPVLWYLCFGLPGLFLSKSLYMLQENCSFSGHEFGRAAGLAHYIIHYPTSRIAALLWLAASQILPPITPLRRVADAIFTAMPTASPQVMALRSAASVLNVSLGGPGSIYAAPDWIGSGTARPSAGMVQQALRLFALLTLLLFALTGFFL